MNVGRYLSGEDKHVGAARITKGLEMTTDPLDTKLPCDIKIGHGTHKKGTTLRSLQTRAQAIYDMAAEHASRLQSELQRKKCVPHKLLADLDAAIAQQAEPVAEAQERARFEAWVSAQLPRLWRSEIENAWDAWRARAMIAASPQPPAAQPGTFRIGQRVRKFKGSQWTGHVVGTYSTNLTPEGYAVESETEKGSVQIYPVGALESIPEPPKEST